MFAELLLMTGLTMPLSPLPASDRHASVLDQEWASEASIQVAQATPPAGGPPPMAARGAGPDGDGMHHGPGFLRGLALTEAQQDQIFNLHYQQMPQMREQMKALRKARQALQDLARSDNFDDQRASALSTDIARIGATMALMRARVEAAVWKILTPEQRQQAERMRAWRGSYGAMHGEMMQGQGSMMRGPMGGTDAPRPPR